MARPSGSIVNTGERKWTVRWFTGRDEVTGKRRYKSKTVHGTKRDAQRRLNEVLRSRDLGEYFDPSTMSLLAYLERWLNDAAQPSLRRRTYDDYKALLEREVLYRQSDRETRRKRTPEDKAQERKPTELAQRPIASLSVMDFQKLYREMGKRGLSRSVRMLHYVLRSAFGQAVDWKLLQRDPTVGAKLPKQPKRAKLALTPEQVAAFRTAAKGNPHALLFDFMLGTGMGPGEALAIRWADLDLKAGRVTLSQTLTREGGRWVIAPGEAKTDQRLRTVVLPASLVSPLGAHKAAQAEIIMETGAGYDRGLDLVFADRRGAVLSPDNIRRRHFAPICKEAKLPKGLRLYDLRHTTATLLLAQGVTPKVVAESLGNSVETLLRHYAHVLPGQQEQAAATLDDLIFG